MSDAATITPPEPAARDVASLLAGIPLFSDIRADDLDDLASAFAGVELAAGKELWCQGAKVDGLHVLLRGSVQVCRRLPGERELELARLDPGAVMGEVALLGGGTRTATVRAVAPSSLLFLDRAEFHARMVSRRPSAIVLRRRIVAIACERLRSVHAALRGSATPAPTNGVAAPTPGEPALPAARTYVARLPLFRDLHEDVVAALLHAGETLHVKRGCTIEREGACANRCFVVLNGAVEELVPRDAGTVRVGFLGPGGAFGYLGLLDGRPASATSVARERSTLLAIDPRDFETLRQGSDERSRAFVVAIEQALMSSLRTAERAQAHAHLEATP